MEKSPERIRLEAEYRKLAKRADQRLVRLERLAKEKHFKSVESYAYARAQKDIKYFSGYEATRFNTKPPTNTSQLKAKIRDIENFLNAPTSTKKGIKTIYQKRADTTNKTYGTNFTWQELANFYESSAKNKLDKSYGSKTLIKALGAIKRIGNEPKQIEEAIKGNIRIAKDEVVDKIAKELLDMGFNADNLFN